jgi:hypothetical protein
VRELAIALLVVTICKCSINPITNPNLVYSQSRDNIVQEALHTYIDTHRQEGIVVPLLN